jgi:hypothetical protein
MTEAGGWLTPQSVEFLIIGTMSLMCTLITLRHVTVALEDNNTFWAMVFSLLTAMLLGVAVWAFMGAAA